jgi:addiction module RelE/StbE family toxin
VNVFWTETAVNHLTAIYGYISQNSPQYAQRVVERLTQRSEQIAQFPLSGRMVPEFEAQQIREVIERPYRIIYHIKPDQIDIIAVLHGSQKLESTEED